MSGSGEFAMDAPQIPGVSRRGFMLAAAALAAYPFLEACTSNTPEELGPPIAPHTTMEAVTVNGETDLSRAGTWQYTPGVQAVGGGVEVLPTGLAIVNTREGGRIDDDPPLNTFGFRLQAEGFVVSARMANPTPTSLQLCGELPQRFDDFLYRKKQMACTLDGNSLVVQVWDGSSQEPAVHRLSFDDLRQPERELTIQRQGPTLSFGMNGQPIGRIDKGDLFKGGAVWLGINSPKGESIVGDFTAHALDGTSLQVVNTTSLRVERPLPGGLQSLVHKPDFRIGAAASLSPLVSDRQYAQLFLGGELGSITTENALKPQDVQPEEGQFTFGPAEGLVTLAERHNVAVHGHTLVYDKAMPSWMQELGYSTPAEKQHIQEVLTTHIMEVVSHFKGRVASWDVVNEAVSGFNDGVGLTESVWYKALGERYFDIAFHAAHAADPAAVLYLNEYGLETNPQGRGQFAYNLCKRLLQRGVPIHGIGLQCHVYQMPRDTVSSSVLRSVMGLFGSLGMKVRISEADVVGSDPTAQAEQFGDMLDVALNAPNCTGMTIWGMNDAYGSTARVDHTGILQPGNALPYTTDYRPKSAREAMVRVLNRV